MSTSFSQVLEIRFDIYPIHGYITSISQCHDPSRSAWPLESIGLFAPPDIFITTVVLMSTQRFAMTEYEVQHGIITAMLEFALSWSYVICTIPVHRHKYNATHSCVCGANTWSLYGSPLCALKHMSASEVLLNYECFWFINYVEDCYAHSNLSYR